MSKKHKKTRCRARFRVSYERAVARKLSRARINANLSEHFRLKADQERDGAKEDLRLCQEAMHQVLLPRIKASCVEVVGQQRYDISAQYLHRHNFNDAAYAWKCLDHVCKKLRQLVPIEHSGDDEYRLAIMKSLDFVQLRSVRDKASYLIERIAHQMAIQITNCIMVQVMKQMAKEPS